MQFSGANNGSFTLSILLSFVYAIHLSLSHLLFLPSSHCLFNFFLCLSRSILVPFYPCIVSSFSPSITYLPLGPITSMPLCMHALRSTSQIWIMPPAFVCVHFSFRAYLFFNSFSNYLLNISLYLHINPILRNILLRVSNTLSWSRIHVLILSTFILYKFS